MLKRPVPLIVAALGDGVAKLNSAEPLSGSPAAVAGGSPDSPPALFWKKYRSASSLFDAIKESLIRGERIELRGFGVFEVKPKKTGIGRNPKTGDEMPIPPGKAIRFKPGKEIRIL